MASIVNYFHGNKSLNLTKPLTELEDTKALKPTELRGLIAALLATFTLDAIEVLINILESYNKENLRELKAELSTTFAAVFPNLGIR